MGCQGSGNFRCDCGASRSRATTEYPQGRAARRGRGHAGRIRRGEENAGNSSATSLAQVRAGGSIKFVGARNRSGRCLQGARRYPAPARGPARNSQASGSAASHAGGNREGGRRRSMSRGGIIFFVIVAAMGGAAAGYWYGRSPTVTRDSPPPAEATAAEAERSILYYRDPSGAPYWSATPKKDDKVATIFQFTMTSHRPRRRSQRLGLHRPVLSGFVITGIQWDCRTHLRFPRKIRWGWTTSRSTKAMIRTTTTPSR